VNYRAVKLKRPGMPLRTASLEHKTVVHTNAQENGYTCEESSVEETPD